jgi:transcriptional regulator with XRE-family HTH domain
MKQTFGTWLKDRRGKRSLRTFAQQVGVDIGVISRIERNCTDVLVSTAVRICRGLDLSVADFFRECLETPLSEAAFQFDQEHWHGALTGQDVQRWLLRILEAHNRELLVSVLNFIRSSEAFTRLSPDQTLVTPPLHGSSIDFVSIYRRGGLIEPAEVGAYVSLVRGKLGFSPKQLSEATGISVGILSNIENGMIKRLKLCDLLSLDNCLQCGGELIVLCWWEVSSRQMLEQEWNQLDAQVLHQLLSLLISASRWLQVIYQQDTIWHSTIRYQLDTPTCYEKAG